MENIHWKYITEIRKGISKHYKQLINIETGVAVGKKIEITHEELIKGK